MVQFVKHPRKLRLFKGPQNLVGAFSQIARQELIQLRDELQGKHSEIIGLIRGQNPNQACESIKCALVDSVRHQFKDSLEAVC